MKTSKRAVVLSFCLASSLAAGAARADNACEGTWDVAVGADLLRIVVDAEGEALTANAHLTRLDADFSLWGFCSTTDGSAAVDWHSDVPTPGGSVYLNFDGVMSKFAAISGTAEDVEGNQFAFSATRVQP